MLMSNDSNNQPIITETDNNNIRTSVLTFDNVDKADEGSYTCTAVNNIENVLNTPFEGSVELLVQGKVINQLLTSHARIC